MAILDIKEQDVRDGARETYDGWHFTRIFQILTDGEPESGYGTAPYNGYQVIAEADDLRTGDLSADPDAASDMEDLPGMGFSHPDAAYSYCKERVPNLAENHRDVFRIKLEYSPLDYDEPDPSKHPAEQKAKAHPSWEPKETPVEFAYADSGDPRDSPSKPVQNSFGKPPQEPITMTVYNRVLELTKFQYNYNDGDYRQYVNTINSNDQTLLGFDVPAGTGLMRNVRANPRRDRDGNAYWEITFEIVQDEDFHKVKLQDTGYSYYDSSDNVVKLDPDEREPVNLDGTGHKASGDPAILAFQPYYPMSWSLGLPSSFS